eukprot:1146076-Pelagomonas_calceolata.AAC.4
MSLPKKKRNSREAMHARLGCVHLGDVKQCHCRTGITDLGTKLLRHRSLTWALNSFAISSVVPTKTKSVEHDSRVICD